MTFQKNCVYRLLMVSGLLIGGLAPQYPVLATPSAQTTQPAPSDWSKQLDQGLELIKQGKLDAAQQIIENLLEAARKRRDRKAEAQGIIALGLIHSRQEQRDLAIQTYRQAISIATVAKLPRLHSLALYRIGQEYQLLEQFQQALDHFKQALSVANNTLDTEDQAWLQTSLGEAYAKLQHSDPAIQHWLLAAELFAQAQRPDGTIELMRRVGWAYGEQKQYEKSLHYLEKALSLQQTQPQPGQTQAIELNLAQSYKGYGDQLKGQGKAQAALTNYQKALPLYHQHRDHYNESLVLFLMGLLTAEQLKQPTQAIEFCQKSLAALKQVSLKDYSQQAIDTASGTVLIQIGKIHAQQSNYSTAIDFYQQALPLFAALNDQPKLAEIYNAMGTFYRRLYIPRSQQRQEFSLKIIDAYRQALTIYQKLGNRPGQSESLKWLQVQHIDDERYFQALEAYRQNLRLQAGEPIEVSTLFAPAPAPPPEPIAPSLAQSPSPAAPATRSGNTKPPDDYESYGLDSLIARLFYTMQVGNLEQVVTAETYIPVLRLTLRNLRSSQRQIDPSAKRSHSSMAAMIHQQALGLAYEFWNQEAELRDRTQLMRSRAANPLLFMGLLYLQTNEPETALRFYQQALAIARTSGDRNAEGNILSYLGQVYDAMDRPQQALDAYQKGLSLLQEAGDRYAAELTLEQMGRTWLKAGNAAAAEEMLLKAMHGWETYRASQTLKLDSDHDIAYAFFYATREDIYHYLQQAFVAQNKHEAALEIAERSRLPAFTKLFAKRSSAPQAAPQILQNLAQIRRVAQERNATLVEYSLIKDVDGVRDAILYIWVIQPNGQIQFRSVDVKSMDTPFQKLVQLSREAIGARGRSTIEVVAPINPQEQTVRLQALHKLLIAPIADSLPHNPDQTVIIIPHRDLFLVPFAALQDQTGRYLIENHTLAVAPSIQTLEMLRHAPERPKSSQALVVGNPTIPELKQVDPKLSQLSLDPLPAAEQEAIAIAQLLNTQPLLGAQATKPRVIQQMKGAQIIHLATHGLLESLRLAQGFSAPGALVLAPSHSSQSPKDALLMSDEVSQLELTADLVVLSACDTGRGEVNGGDGIVGLARSFLLARVPSVVVSLWAVPDAPTADLMTEFYTNWKGRNLTKAQALRQAMLTVKQTRPNPIDWAAFTLIGDVQ